ncbi:MAG: amino acid permease [Betaproteobacteria bacterium RIFCSPLOWO2_12_FULL_64_23]|nr:MAG: amino acid permease [Betaproteobacteria bacterium RIFCSPLOWO2_12_FULL_64_23]
MSAQHENTTQTAAQPKPVLELRDTIALIVGIVVGAGIFKTPSLVAANAGDAWVMLGAWLLGGAVSLIGALCYAELATACPHAGGEYHFLTRAYGRKLSFLFAWARLAVITTGSIALLAFVFGDYCSRLYSLGGQSSAIYAALIVVALTAVNIAGVKSGAATQNWLTALQLSGLLALAVAGLALAPAADTAAAPAGADPGQPAFGLAMVFVLLTYGGWNEAAYISAEVKPGRRNMLRALMWSMFIVTALYLLVNLAYLRGLGLAGMARSQVVAADLLQQVWGSAGAQAISVLIAISALTSINATIIFGARSNYALGCDWPLLGFLGRWNARTGSPTQALLAQGAVALVLIAFGARMRQGFETMVDYIAPVFWLFFLLTGLALFVLRWREPELARPFRVPLYPLLPLAFCASSAWLLYSSLAYTRLGALVGVGVLAAGVPLLALAARRGPKY